MSVKLTIDTNVIWITHMEDISGQGADIVYVDASKDMYLGRLTFDENGDVVLNELKQIGDTVTEIDGNVL
jgi:hypothetical protein